MRSDGKAFGFREYSCPVCGRKFVPAPFHMYDDNGVLLCSYPCDLKNARQKKSSGPPAKSVQQFTLSGVYVATFETAEKAAEAVGVMHAGNIRNCCAGHTKSSGGYIWRYKKEETSSDAVESLG